MPEPSLAPTTPAPAAPAAPAHPVAPDNSKSGKMKIVAENTTQLIAYILMGVYCLCILVLLVAAISFYNFTGTDGKLHDDRWLLVFKDSFAFLGGLLATIVGYYFGNRNVDNALNEVKKQEAQVTQVKEQVKVQEQIADAYKSVAAANETKLEPSALAATAPTTGGSGVTAPSVSLTPVPAAAPVNAPADTTDTDAGTDDGNN